MARPSNSLPVPDSPEMCTAMSLFATREASSITPFSGLAAERTMRANS